MLRPRRPPPSDHHAGLESGQERLCRVAAREQSQRCADAARPRSGEQCQDRRGGTAKPARARDPDSEGRGAERQGWPSAEQHLDGVRGERGRDRVGKVSLSGQGGGWGESGSDSLWSRGGLCAEW